MSHGGLLDYRLALLILCILVPGCGPEPSRPDPLPQPNYEALSAEGVQKVRTAHRQAVQTPADPAAVGQVGMLLHAYGQTELAAIYYARAAALAPREFKWAYLLGVAEQSHGNFAQAQTALEQALALDPVSNSARLRLAEILSNQGKHQQARGHYQQVLAHNPRSGFAHYGLARGYQEAGQIETALQHFQQALELTPDLAEAHYALAALYRKLGQEREAVRHEQVFNRSSKNRTPRSRDPLEDAVQALRSDSAQYHFEQGRAFEAQGDLDKAITAYQEAIRRDPTFAYARINLMPLYSQNGDFAAAQKQYELAIAADPGIAEAYYNAGMVQSLQGAFRAAIPLFERSLELEPANADALNNLGLSLENLGRNTSAIQRYKQALSFHPGHRLASYNLGRILLEQGAPAQALPHLEHALDPQTPQAPRILFMLSLAHRQLGNRQESDRNLQLARQQAMAQGQMDLLAEIDRLSR